MIVLACASVMNHRVRCIVLPHSYGDVSNFYVARGVSYSTQSPGCGGAVTFQPEAAADYEVGFSWQGRTCSISVYQIQQQNGVQVMKAVPITPAPNC